MINNRLTAFLFALVKNGVSIRSISNLDSVSTSAKTKQIEHVIPNTVSVNTVMHNTIYLRLQKNIYI